MATQESETDKLFLWKALKHFIILVSRRFPRLTNLILVVVSFFIVICCVEICCYLLYQKKILHDPKKSYTQGYFQYDSVLGYKPKACNEISSTLIADKKTIYDVIYTIDMFHRRFTPVTHKEKRTKFALFFGCSCTFGEGVENDETFPYYFSEFSPDYMPYNYGFHGYGPQEMLAKLEDDSIRKEVNEYQGIAVYLYLPNVHEQRAIGNMLVFNAWGKTMPFYMIDSRDNLVRHGNFLSGRPFISNLYRVLGKSYFIKYFDIQLPPQITDAHYKLTARIIEEARNAFDEKFMNSRFYVVIYPNDTTNNIIPYLKKARIKYFDYSKLFDSSLEQYYIAGDGHPTPESYRTLAKQLSEDILKLTNSEPKALFSGDFVTSAKK